MHPAHLLKVTNTEINEIAYVPVSSEALTVNLTCERSVKYVIQHGALSYLKVIVSGGATHRGQMPPPCTVSTVV